MIHELDLKNARAYEQAGIEAGNDFREYNLERIAYTMACKDKNKQMVDFVKWLKHLDNGTTHYNPHTMEETESIGFSPYDCFIDNTKSPEELLAIFLNQYK